MEGRASASEGVADEEKGGTGGGNLLPEVSIFSGGLRCVYGNSRPPSTEGSFQKAKGNPHATTISRWRKGNSKEEKKKDGEVVAGSAISTGTRTLVFDYGLIND